ncbi:MAG: SAVED domain-containing protein [Sphingomonadales bacterium]|nr:MAG: SAVED domain-containing protein [Sphingomonadales bacterium]
MMARTKGVSPRVRNAIWARAAGRCMFPGCNQDLTGDLISGLEDRNFGFIAHIVADIPGGPRGDPVRSPALCNEPGNLMLLCGIHHKVIDVDQAGDFPESRLLAIKADHERRIAIATDIDGDRASHILRYAANIGHHESPVAYEQMSIAMLPDRYPATGRQTLDLEMLGCTIQDHEPAYWAFHRENLGRQFAAKVRDRIESREVRHLSVFGLAPQPLLIELGRLLGDIVATDVRQLHREPKGWRWAEDEAPLKFIVHEPQAAMNGPIALKLAVSGPVDEVRIRDVLGTNAEIWSLSIPEPGNDVVRRPEDLAAFRKAMRGVYRDIKDRHGDGKMISVFPVLPVSLAVEAGRVWMPKADLALKLFDQVRGRGFVEAFTIGEQ